MYIYALDISSKETRKGSGGDGFSSLHRQLRRYRPEGHPQQRTNKKRCGLHCEITTRQYLRIGRAVFYGSAVDIFFIRQCHVISYTCRERSHVKKKLSFIRSHKPFMLPLSAAVRMYIDAICPRAVPTTTTTTKRVVSRDRGSRVVGTGEACDGGGIYTVP